MGIERRICRVNGEEKSAKNDNYFQWRCQRDITKVEIG